MLDQLTIKKAVEFAITTEQQGARIYRKLAKRYADNEELVALFEKLAGEEDAHEKSLTRLLDKVPDDEASSGDEKFQYLRAVSISEFFSGKLFDRDQLKTREDALQRALELEKATLQYYQAMVEVLGDNEALDFLIKAERRHVLSIMRYLLTEEQVKDLPST